MCIVNQSKIDHRCIEYKGQIIRNWIKIPSLTNNIQFVEIQRLPLFIGTRKFIFSTFYRIKKCITIH